MPTAVVNCVDAQGAASRFLAPEQREALEDLICARGRSGRFGDGKIFFFMRLKVINHNKMIQAQAGETSPAFL